MLLGNLTGLGFQPDKWNSDKGLSINFYIKKRIMEREDRCKQKIDRTGEDIG